MDWLKALLDSAGPHRSDGNIERESGSGATHDFAEDAWHVDGVRHGGRTVKPAVGEQGALRLAVPPSHNGDDDLRRAGDGTAAGRGAALQRRAHGRRPAGHHDGLLRAADVLPHGDSPRHHDRVQPRDHLRSLHGLPGDGVPTDHDDYSADIDGPVHQLSDRLLESVYNLRQPVDDVCPKRVRYVRNRRVADHRKQQWLFFLHGFAGAFDAQPDADVARRFLRFVGRSDAPRSGHQPRTGFANESRDAGSSESAERRHWAAANVQEHFGADHECHADAASRFGARRPDCLDAGPPCVVLARAFGLAGSPVHPIPSGDRRLAALGPPRPIRESSDNRSR